MRKIRDKPRWLNWAIVLAAGSLGAALGFFLNLHLVMPPVNDISMDGATFLMALSVPGLVLGFLVGAAVGLLIGNCVCKALNILP